MKTQVLFDRYYRSKPDWVDGTEMFHDICAKSLKNGRRILEIGAGPSNGTTAFLARLGSVVGLDVSNEVQGNSFLSEAHIYDGTKIPFLEASFDMCVSNYVLEHIADPKVHFAQVHRVLKAGGAYCFRTPNRWHYTAIASSLLSHSMHLRVANRLRAMSPDAHDPWPTWYRANRCGQLRRLAEKTGFYPEALALVEKEPSYGAAHWLLFYPMMAYERAVNFTDWLRHIRANIFGTFRKPLPEPLHL
jgi:SAM-dependent methyltransferase